MIPQNEITPVPIVRGFIYPYNEPYHRLSQNVLGGIALNDPSEGRMYKVWNVSYDGVSIHIKPSDGPVAFSLTVPDVLTVSLAFDNNMGITLTWTTSTGANLYYYDALTDTYLTRFFIGVTSSRLCVDKADDFYLTDSDVIFSYTLNGALYYRQQRDRYDVERFIGATLNTLLRAAPNHGNRLQFQLLSRNDQVSYIVYDTFTGTGDLVDHTSELANTWLGTATSYELNNGVVCPVTMQLGDPMFVNESAGFLNGYVEVSFRF